MGRKNKSYSKDLHQQAYEKLTSMLALGESKREAVLNGTADDKIFSVNTYKTYWKHIKYFLKYVKEKYPECLCFQVNLQILPLYSQWFSRLHHPK